MKGAINPEAFVNQKFMRNQCLNDPNVGGEHWVLAVGTYPSSVGSDVKVNDKQSWKQVSKESNGLIGIEIQWIATTLI